MRRVMENQATSPGERDDYSTEAINNRLHYFKYNTLPVIGHYDDEGKLYVVCWKTEF